MNERLRAVSRTIWKDWIKPLAIVVVVLTTFRSAVADWNDVPTGSMRPTILEGDRILVNKLAFGLRVPFTLRWFVQWDEPARGDVVVLHSPADGTRLVKRVVGLPGDTVEMRDNRLLINGAAVRYLALDESIVGWIPAEERARHEFASEAIAGVGHPVMVTPLLPAMRSFGPVVLPAGQFFVLGDNRDQSADSRAFGFVKRGLIVGRSSVVAFSLDRDRYYLPRVGRFFRALP